MYRGYLWKAAWDVVENFYYNLAMIGHFECREIARYVLFNGCETVIKNLKTDDKDLYEVYKATALMINNATKSGQDRKSKEVRKGKFQSTYLVFKTCIVIGILVGFLVYTTLEGISGEKRMKGLVKHQTYLRSTYSTVSPQHLHY